MAMKHITRTRTSVIGEHRFSRTDLQQGDRMNRERETETEPVFANLRLLRCTEGFQARSRKDGRPLLAVRPVWPAEAFPFRTCIRMIPIDPIVTNENRSVHGQVLKLQGDVYCFQPIPVVVMTVDQHLQSVIVDSGPTTGFWCSYGFGPVLPFGSGTIHI